MNCHRIQRMLSPYLDGELRPDRLAAVRRHLEACAACRGRLESLRSASDRLAGWDPPPLPAGLTGRILAAAGRDAARRTVPSRPAWSLRVAGAAAALLCALAGAYLGSLAAPSPLAAAPPASVRPIPPGVDPMQPLYSESFRLLPSGSPGAEYLALIQEGGN